MPQEFKPLQIGDVTIDVPIILAPMAGVTDLPFRLLSDSSTRMLQDFGAWGEKKMCGKTSVGTLRRTFIFDEDGILERVIEKVDTKNAAGQVLEQDVQGQ